MFWRSITVREVTRHLSKLVDELLLKHGNVTSRAFEEELEKRSGIHWKQVKNYRNHPTPDQVIRENSKVKAFVYENRRRELARALTSRRVTASACAGLFAIIAVVWLLRDAGHRAARIVVRPKPLQVVATDHGFVPFQPKLKFKIPGFGPYLQVGEITPKIQAIRWDNCMVNGDLHRCSIAFDGGLAFGQLNMSIQGGEVQTFTVFTRDQKVVNSLKDQIKEQTKWGFTYHKDDGYWAGTSETVSVTETRVPSSPAKSSFTMFVMEQTHRAARRAK